MKLSRASLQGGLLFVLSAAAFAWGFGTAYRQDKARVLEEGELARLHLFYALEMKDDMGLIDWSKNLGNLRDVRAFQASVNSKVVAEGGNRNLLPAAPEAGVSYSFPDQWCFDWAGQRDPQTRVSFLWVCRTRPGPFLWGLLCFFAALLTALGALGVRSLPRVRSPGPEKPGSLPFPIPVPQPPPPPGQPSGEDRAFLSIARNGRIRQVSPRAAHLLRREESSLRNGHILDLNPDPSLLKAIGKSDQARFADPFLSCPGISAVLSPEEEGSLLVLEGTKDVQPPQKR